MRLRSVIQWTIFLLLLIAGAGGYYAHQAWERKDQMLLEGIRSEIARKAPDWDVGIEDAHIVNVQGQVRLTDISIKPRGEDTAVLHIPECFIKLDPDLLLKEYKVLVRSVRVSNPTVTLIRHEDGSWNWQKLGKPAPSEHTPEIEVEGGTFVVKLEAGVGMPETELASRDVALFLAPSGQHRYLIEGATQIDGAGRLAFAGKVDLDHGTWELAGKADGLDMSPQMLEKATALSPALQRQVAELSQQGIILTPDSSPLPVPEPRTQENFLQTVSQSRTVPGTPSQLSLPDLGLIANIGVEFAIRSDGQQKIPDYRVLAKIMDGQVTEPLSPVPLSGLQGELLIENDRVIIEKLSAANGDSKLYVAGEVRKLQEETITIFDVEATNLWLDEEIRSVLPPEGQKLFDLVNPSGLFTIKARYDSQAEKPLKLDRFQAHDCRIQHALYPYPVTHIAGSVTQHDQRLILDLTGVAAERPVKLDGEITNLGPSPAIILHVLVNDFPLDPRFTDALVSEKHFAARRAIEALNLTGLADLRLQFARSGRPGEKFQMGLDADVKQARMRLDQFPYEVTDLTGHVHHDPWKENVWNFSDLHGRHGSAVLAGAAKFDLTAKPGQLEVLVNAQNARLDEDLRDATVTANPVFATAWNELNPTGTVDVEGFRLTWQPGFVPEVIMPTVRLSQGTVTLASFPYRWDRVTADVSWNARRVNLRHAEGHHNETHAVIESGAEEYAAYFEVPTDQEYRWRLRLPQVIVTHLDPGSEYRAALPPEIAAVVETLNPRGPLDLQMALEIRSFPQAGAVDLLTSHSQLQVDLTNDQLSAGLDMTNVTGRVEANITWDGVEVTSAGTVDFQTARALDMTCTNLQGPFEVQGMQIVAGSADMLRVQAPDEAKPAVPSNEQITAKLYDGIISVNAVAKIDPRDAEQTDYRADVDLRNADLSQWMSERWPESANVTGTVNGQMNLSGRGSSPRAVRGENCWVQITDTQLGELPVMAQMLSSLVQPQMRTVDKTAFRYAYADFSVEDGRFDFGRPGNQDPRDTRRIQLDGSVLKMIGQGTVPFAPSVDPRMQLDFYSKVDNRGNPLMALPIVNTIGRSFSDNWIHVRVSGTPGAPVVQTMPNVPLNNANDVLRGFVNTLEQGLNPMLPRPVPPRGQ